MKNGLHFFLSVFMLALTVGSAWAQSDAEQKIYRADKYFGLKNYEAALELYEEAIGAGVSDAQVLYRAGVSKAHQMHVDQQIEAISWLKGAAASGKVPVDVYYYLGDLYHKNAQIAEAISSFEKYQAEAKDKGKMYQLSEEKLDQSRNALSLMSQKKDIEVFPFGSNVNTPATEYNPVVSADESVMAFTAMRKDEKGRGFVEEIQIVEKDEHGNWLQAQKVDIPTKYNVGTAGLSPDGRHMLIFIGGANNTGNIYSIDKEGKKWSVPAPVGEPVNSRYLETTASITADNKTIYFASNRPDGYGGMDIYMATRRDDGGWNRPVNLGPEINTDKDEDAPFIHPDQRTLYFTSSGHNSMGGKDIFKVLKVGSGWSSPENMGYPINTTANDNYFTLTADGKKGFFSSDRKGGSGAQDVYYFQMPDQYANIPMTLIKGQILAGESLEPVPTKIKVIDKSTNTKVDYVYDPDPETGYYLIIFPPGKNYDMIIEAEGYMPYTVNVNIPNQNYFYELYQRIYLKPIVQFDEMVGQEVSVKNAFFDTKTNADVNPRAANEAMLIEKDSIDVYELMESIIAANDTAAYDYLMDLMYKTNPVSDIDFDAKSDLIETADIVYYYEENDPEDLEMRIVDNDTIMSLPTFFVSKEAKRQAEEQSKPLAYDKSLLEKVHKIYFDTDQSTLTTKGETDLQNVLGSLSEYDGLGIEISGFASSDGNADYNRNLSNQRAISVLNFFNERGVARRRIIAKGYGATQNQSDKKEARRVEIRLVDLSRQ
ncbi:OmpA family protein [Roseivirga sp. BDSF3-8]|uniref:OmpA family protein n=1 Tax=Roseivirga sp. BDSF3-8 TaxID=3241598 RepID=UPI003532009D